MTGRKITEGLKKALLLGLGAVTAGSIFAGLQTGSQPGKQPAQAIVAEAAEVEQSDLSVNFVIVENAYIRTPAKGQNIVLDIGDGNTKISTASLTVQNTETGKVKTAAASKINAGTMAFSFDFTDSRDAGIYMLKTLSCTGGGRAYTLNLPGAGVKSVFGVDRDPGSNQTAGGVQASDVTEALKDATSAVLVQKAGAGQQTAGTGDLSAAGKKTKSKAPGNLVIVLDPGHGGWDGGATSTFNGVTYVEKEINLKIAKACKAELEKQDNITVYMTREDNTSTFTDNTSDELTARCTYAHEKNADLYVSLHCNSSTSPSARGTEVEIPNANYNTGVYNVGKTVADSILARLQALGMTNLGAKIRNSETGNTYADGSAADYYAVVRQTKLYGIPGMIVEHAYLSNYQECLKYFGSDASIAALGRADAAGILDQLSLIEQNRVDGGVTKAGWTREGSDWIYTDADGNIKTGFFDVAGQTYYARDNGRIVTGWQLINGKWYYFEKSGAMDKSAWKLGSNSRWMYLDSKGVMQTGRVAVGSKTYIFNNDGYMYTGWFQYGGKWHFAGSDGTLLAGSWKKSADGRVWYYLNANGDMATGWENVRGVWYYMNTDGVMQTGWQLVNGRWYDLAPDGYMLSNCWIKDKGKWYYLGSSGAAAVDWYQVNGSWFFGYPDGSIATGWQMINGKWYYFNDDGYMFANTWKKSKDGSVWYYLTAGGSMAKSQWQAVGNAWYWFDGSGVIQTGWQLVNGSWYFMNEDGVMSASAWKKSADGVHWYYLTADGKMAKNEILTINGTDYCFNADGLLTSGWAYLDDDYYWINSDGTVRKSAWYQDGSSRWYYLKADGKMAVGPWTVGGKIYFFESNGMMSTTAGWKHFADDDYYVNSDGTLTVSDFRSYGNGSRYLDPDGKAASGFRDINGGTYYFDPGNSNLMVTGKQTIDGKEYDFGTNGVLSGTEVTLHAIMGASEKTETSLTACYNRQGYPYPAGVMAAGGAPTIGDFVRIIREETDAEGVKAEVVFAQIMNETNWLQFGGDVSASQYNFAGLGATGNGEPGLSFADVRTGIRAEVQHLKAYASTDPLKQACVDPRFDLVKRGTAPYVEYLGIQENPNGGGWAAAPQYGQRILNIMYRIDQ